MKLPLSILCNSKTHCTTCRDYDNKQWRERLVQHYDISDIDFVCPIGKQWDEITEPPIIERVEATIEPITELPISAAEPTKQTNRPCGCTRTKLRAKTTPNTTTDTR